MVTHMNIPKIALLIALGCTGLPALADEDAATATAANLPVENYSYGTRLDIKKVISHSDTPDQCGAVPVRMQYEDSNGQQHVLQYLVMGECSNG